MPVTLNSLKEANALHPLSLINYLLHLGNVATIFTTISTLSTVSFNDQRIQSICIILVVSAIHSGFQLAAYIGNMIRHDCHQLNAHMPHITHGLAVAAMAIVSFCSIGQLKTPADMTGISGSLLTYFRFMFGFNIVHWLTHSVWIGQNGLNLQEAFNCLCSIFKCCC
jgi:hypothetical protein